MAKRKKSESVTDDVKLSLRKYFEANVRPLRQVLDGFPSSNQRLRTPSVTIYSSRTEFMPMISPMVLKKGVVKDSKAQALWYVGDYDIDLKLDLWCGNKEELDDVYLEVFNALNPKISTMGLELSLPNYYNIRASYLYMGHTEESNNEQDSRMDNWRYTLDVLTTCNAIRTRQEYIIENIEVKDEISETVLI